MGVVGGLGVGGGLVGGGSPDLGAVLGGGEEMGRLAVDLNLEDPTFAEGVSVEKGGIGGEGGIDRDDGSGNWGIDIAGGFDGFDNTDGGASGDRGADFGELDIDDIGEFGLGMIGDADCAIWAEPFVTGSVLE